MIERLLLNYDEIPKQVKFAEIKEFERMEERFFDIEQHYGDILGMNIDYIEFCPNNQPPLSNDEIIPWLWLIHPEWKNEILEFADEKLKRIIQEYEEYEPL